MLHLGRLGQHRAVEKQTSVPKSSVSVPPPESSCDLVCHGDEEEVAEENHNELRGRPFGRSRKSGNRICDTGRPAQVKYLTYSKRAAVTVDSANAEETVRSILVELELVLKAMFLNGDQFLPLGVGRC